nr:hypothetical protein [Candidatus Sigynarchaeota archaeon]
MSICHACIMMEFFCIYPWFFGGYEELNDPGQPILISLGIGIVLGIIIASVAAAFGRLNIRSLGSASAAITFVAAVLAVYASIFAITVLELACSAAIGAMGTVLLVSTNYTNSHGLISNQRLRDLHVLEACAAVLFLSFNAWLVGSSWSFRHVGIAFISGLLLVAFSYAKDIHVRDIKTIKSWSTKRTAEAILLGIHALLLLVVGAAIGFVVVSRVKTTSLDMSFQGFLNQMLLIAAIGIAVITAGLVIFIVLEKESADIVKRKTFHQLAPVILMPASTVCLAIAGYTFWNSTGIDIMDVQTWIAVAGIAVALFFESMIILQQLTRKSFVTLILATVLIALGVLFVTDMKYPQDWMRYPEGWIPLKDIFTIVVLVAIATGIAWFAVSLLWKTKKSTQSTRLVTKEVHLV